MNIRIGILGYGNLGRGIELAVKNNNDMELVGIFTRRNPKEIKPLTNVKVISITEIENWKDKIDVLILCGGSATDLPEQTPKYAKMFNVIDSFDTHANIYQHFCNVDKASREGNKVSLISCGWDPGVFSINRLMSECFLPDGKTYTFWGPGVSQGHSQAIRRIDGVVDAIQYTMPKKDTINLVREGDNTNFKTNEMHYRECYVVVKDDANKEKIENTIKNMPNYFAEYDTDVHFVSESELKINHSKMPHGGFVIRSGKTGLKNENNQVIEYSLKLDSNPEFTGSIIVSYARAIYSLYKNGESGAKTVFDIPPILLTNKNNVELLQKML